MKTVAVAVLLGSLLPSALFAKNMYVPVAGSAPGANGTFFRTDLRIFNPSDEHEIDVTLHFLPQGLDGSNISGRVFHLEKRQVLVLDDVVATLAPELVPAVGAIRIDSDTDQSYEFIASSRTYTRSSFAPGTYGQFVPAAASTDARTSTIVLHASRTPEFRTNAGVMNPNRVATTVRVRLFGIDGKVFQESGPLVVPAMSMTQWSLDQLFGGLFVQDAFIGIESSAPVFTWGSVIDNISGDAIFVRGVEDDDTVRPLAVTSSSSGSAGAP